MAWYSHTLALAIPEAQADPGADPRKLLDGSKQAMDRFVYAPSRNGCLLGQLGRICEQATNGENLYLLTEACLLKHEAIERAAKQLEALLNEIEVNPALVVEATKDPHQPSTTLLAEGFEPLPAQYVYPSDAIIKDGWVYYHSEEQVRHLLEQAGASKTPCPDGDDDGESLAYVFSFLKSHLSLLRFAAQSGQAVAYGEMNQ
jgi:hypothetical protein